MKHIQLFTQNTLLLYRSTGLLVLVWANFVITQLMDIDSECLKEPGGFTYAGRLSNTPSGYCVRWNDRSIYYPDSETRTIVGNVQNYPDGRVDHNYCRNPVNDPKGPWCYLEGARYPHLRGEGQRWAYCEIQLCSQNHNSSPRPNFLSINNNKDKPGVEQEIKPPDSDHFENSGTVISVCDETGNTMKNIVWYKVGAMYLLRCAPGCFEARPTSLLRGCNVYSRKSNLCLAAKHSGIKEGEIFKLIVTESSFFTKCTRNGISSHNYGMASGDTVFVYFAFQLQRLDSSFQMNVTSSHTNSPLHTKSTKSILGNMWEFPFWHGLFFTRPNGNNHRPQTTNDLSWFGLLTTNLFSHTTTTPTPRVSTAFEGNYDPYDCYITIDQYSGKRATTVSGKSCVKWNDPRIFWFNSRLQRQITDTSKFPEGHINHNYCRNPDRDLNGPWCYIEGAFNKNSNNEGDRFEYCGIKICPTKSPPEHPEPGSLAVAGPGTICGKRRYENIFETRVIGGTSSREGEWPWLVKLSSRYMCGGTLIHSRWIATASHCFYNQFGQRYDSPSYWRVSVGEHNVNVHESFQQTGLIDKIILHPDYRRRGSMNDIALIRLKHSIILSEHANIACLSKEQFEFGVGKTCYVAGWGRTEHGQTSKIPRHVDLKLVSIGECARKNRRRLDPKLYICAANDQAGKDSCKGDSGGPLMCQSNNGQWVFVGVTSHGRGCGIKGFPGIYTRVHSYTDWIRTTLSKFADY